MNKSVVKGIVIAAGAIVVFLLGRFLPYAPPFDRALIAVLALIFGHTVGGAVGLLGQFFTSLSFGFNMWNIPYILLNGLYGFVIGKLSENKSTEPEFDNSIGNIGVFALSATVLQIITSIIGFIFTTIRFRGNQYVSIQPLSTATVVDGLVAGITAFVLVFICHKFLKVSIPPFAGNKFLKTIISSAQKPEPASGENVTTGENTITGELVKCSACGKEYYYKADKCPNCGKINPIAMQATKKLRTKVIIIGIILGVVGVIIAGIVGISIYPGWDYFLNGPQIPDKF